MRLKYYASCASAISLPKYDQIQICFLNQNNRTNSIYILKLYTAHMRRLRENAVIRRAYTLELIQALYVQNDKENGVDFYNSFFSKRSDNLLRFHEFSRSFRSTKTEKLSYFMCSYVLQTRQMSFIMGRCPTPLV